VLPYKTFDPNSSLVLVLDSFLVINFWLWGWGGVFHGSLVCVFSLLLAGMFSRRGRVTIPGYDLGGNINIGGA
jgi:hypothetical protein